MDTGYLYTRIHVVRYMHPEACFNAVRETMLLSVELAHDYAHWLLGTVHASSSKAEIQIRYT